MQIENLERKLDMIDYRKAAKKEGVSPDIVYRLAELGKIEYFRIGPPEMRRIVVHPGSLHEYLVQHKFKK